MLDLPQEPTDLSQTPEDSSGHQAQDPGLIEALAGRSEAGLPPCENESLFRAWIARVIGQDEEAFASLYDALVGRVFGLALKITGCVQMAEEVAEDTFWQVWRQAPRFDPDRGTALAWVMTIARSRALDALRAKTPTESLDDMEALLASLTDGDDPAESAQARQEAVRLHGALASLDAVPRQLVALAFFRGLSHEEIAEQTNLPLGTVKSQIRRALLKLRELLV